MTTHQEENMQEIKAREKNGTGLTENSGWRLKEGKQEN